MSALQCFMLHRVPFLRKNLNLARKANEISYQLHKIFLLITGWAIYFSSVFLDGRIYYWEFTSDVFTDKSNVDFITLTAGNTFSEMCYRFGYILHTVYEIRMVEIKICFHFSSVNKQLTWQTLVGRVGLFIRIYGTVLVIFRLNKRFKK